MIDFVIDNSVILSWLLPNEASRESLVILNKLKVNKAHAPSLWPYELANALYMAEKRNRIQESDSLRFIDILSQLPIFVEETVLSRVTKDVLKISKTYGITVYDASYIECALRNSIPLVSFDKEIVSACKKLNIGGLKQL